MLKIGFKFYGHVKNCLVDLLSDYNFDFQFHVLYNANVKSYTYLNAILAGYLQIFT